jgi:cytochrome c-type biogenesis protein CcmH
VNASCQRRSKIVALRFLGGYLLGFVLSGSIPLSMAVVPLEEQLTNPVLEERAQLLGHQFRCVTCAGQTINDSSAPLAEALRQTVREQLQNGATDGEIVTFIRERYGDDILQTPPFSWRTAALWLFPISLLVIGLMVALHYASTIRKTFSDE